MGEDKKPDHLKLISGGSPEDIFDDIEGLRKHYPDQEVAEIVYHVTQAAFFDRLTEAAGLRLEP